MSSALSLHGGMVVLPDHPPTAELETGPTTVSMEALGRFTTSAGLQTMVRRPSDLAPLSFALSLRRGHSAGASISPRAFAIHGGHDIQEHSPIVIGQTYVVTERIERAFAKTGRSGKLAIVERRIWIRDVRGPLAAEVTDRQIVRWRPHSTPTPTIATVASTGSRDLTDAATTSPSDRAPVLEVGDSLGPLFNSGISAQQISRWADALRDREVLFHDRSEARRLGYDNLVVPGPLQSAVVDCWLEQATPAWRPKRLHMTFRQSLLAGQPLRVDFVVIDADARRCTLDILIRNTASNETTATGTVELQPTRER